MKNSFLFFMFLAANTLLFAQEPAHFLLGEKLFDGVEIYDVIQDKELNYWIATNEGIYKYDSYNFQKVSNPDIKSNSLFRFIINSEGKIYCHNLNNQIFEIKNGELNLFYELGKEKSNADISITITNKDELFIIHKGVTVLDKKGNEVHEYTSPFSYLYVPYSLLNNIVVTHLGRKDSLLLYDGEKFWINPLKKINFNGVVGALKFFRTKNNYYAVDVESKNFFLFNEVDYSIKLIKNTYLPDNLAAFRVYEANNTLWFAGAMPGALFAETIHSSTEFTTYFKDYFISDVYIDFEGNTILSTFDNGMLVIPNMNIPGVISELKKYSVVSTTFDSKLGLLLGTSKGSLVAYNKKEVKPLINSGTRSLKAVYSSDDFPFIIIDDGKIKAIDKKTWQPEELINGSLKDVVFYDNTTFYMALNFQVVKTTWENKKFIYKQFPELRIRSYQIELDKETKEIYVSTATGLKMIDQNEVVTDIKNNGNEIYPLHLANDDEYVYASLRDNTLIKLKNGKVIQEITPIINGKDIEVQKFIIVNNSIIASTNLGIVRLDMNGKLIKHFNKSQGFSTSKIIDFVINGSNLWVSHSRGLQQLNINEKEQPTKPPSIRLAKILVNDNSISFSANKEFQYSKRKFNFILSSPTLKNKQDIRYSYKLVGYDKDWITSAYEDNSIIYNALAPGTYTFVAKAANHGKFGKPVTYSFIISAPFYYQWWFSLFIALISIAIVTIVYRNRLRIQKRKAQLLNELNNSKLTAIQSQMNPHFIFNALNSIQDLVLKGDVDNSYTYITKFSNLVRKTLKYSEKDFIEFEQEIELLTLYLTLEKLRFKKELEFKIDTKKITDILIPPMLIQPFIENALVHGLLHKAGERKIFVRFKLKKMLICEIEDNGIGRAKEIKERQQSQHESFSVNAIKNRFEILSNYFEADLGYQYEDLLENGIATGTRVTLKIPIQRKF